MPPSKAAESTGAAQFRMAFVLPKKFTEAPTAPQPTNEEVEVARVHWGTVAVSSFSGWCSASDVVALEADFVQVCPDPTHACLGFSAGVSPSLFAKLMKARTTRRRSGMGYAKRGFDHVSFASRLIRASGSPFSAFVWTR